MTQEMTVYQEPEPCQCGCGKLPKIGRRFIHGHNNRGANNYNWNGGKCIHPLGYVLIRYPDHPRSNALGYVREHILIAEKILGRLLPLKAEIHHVNGNRSDNRSNNLIICPNRAYHMFIHQRERALRACGNVHWLKCAYCGKYDDPANMTIRPKKSQGWHKGCATKRMKEKRYGGK